MNPKPYSPLRNPVDLTNCDAEPVAFIGSVQPHGALLVVDPDTLKVVQYSANAPVFFDIEASKILGGSVNDLTSWNLNDEILLLPPRDTDRTYKKNQNQSELEPIFSTGLSFAFFQISRL